MFIFPWLLPIIPNTSRSINKINIMNTVNTKSARILYSLFRKAIAPSFIRFPISITSLFSTLLLCTRKNNNEALTNAIAAAIIP